MTIILFAVWSLACVGFGIAATFWVASKLAARDKHAPAPRPAPLTAETALRLWTPTASGGYRLTYVDDGQPVGLIANNKAEWTLVPAHPRNVYVSEVGETQYQG